MIRNRKEGGFALVTVMLLLGLIMTLLAAYFSLTRIELGTTKSTMDSFRGFYASEAGLNLRADGVRDTFVGYNRPAGDSPETDGGVDPCYGSNQGTGDLACETFSIQDRNVATYLEEAPDNPKAVLIPRGEAFQNLHAQEYRYVAFSEASRTDGLPEAVLEMHFRSRLVPMFQFAAFYNKDLEILPGQAMTLAGAVHTNGDLYLDNSAGGLSVLGQITTSGVVYKGRKNQNVCESGSVSVADPENLTALPACSSGRRQYDDGDVEPWNGQIQMGYDVLTVPAPEELDPNPGAIYWDKADIRIMLDLNPATPTIKVYGTDGAVDTSLSTALNTCSAVSRTTSFRNRREDMDIQMLDVNARALLDCIHTHSLMGFGKGLNETSEGGLVWYLGVFGPDQDDLNNYGVRLFNGGTLSSTLGGAPAIVGLTVVTNQAVYIRGDWNKNSKKPSAFLADSLNVLSNNWNDANDTKTLVYRPATPTTINAAFLAGTDYTGGLEGVAGQDSGDYNGGLENYSRLHELWTGQTLTYRGSFVSLNKPRHVDGLWFHGEPQYKAPIRDFGYDTDFNDAAKLPPLTPRFVYLRQELFVRHFEL